MTQPRLFPRALLAAGLILLAVAVLTGWRAPVGRAATLPAAAHPLTVINPLLEDFESGVFQYTQFLSDVPSCPGGGCGWHVVSTAAHGGIYSAYAPDLGQVADQRLVTADAVALPAEATSATLSFYQRYAFETGSGGERYDGGVFEVSTNGGMTWEDAGALITSGGYTGTIVANQGNPLAGRLAWSGTTNGAFVPVQATLLLLAGHNVAMRFRLGTDANGTGAGWWIDDVQISYQAPAPCGAAAWTTGAAYPTAVGGPAAVAVDAAVYVFGGQHGATWTTAANKYDAAGNIWTPLAPLPVAVSGASAVTDGGNIYILNGLAAGTASAHLYRYNVATNTYTPLATPPTATGYQGAAYLNGKIYRIGGTGSSTVINSVDVYSVATNTWAPAAAYPQALTGLAAVALGGYIYTAGGNAPGGIPSAKTYRYDPAANSWSDAAIADLPGPLADVGGALYNGRWIVAAGRVQGESAGVLAWDAAADRWTSLSRLAQPSAGAAVAAAAGRLVVAAGTTGDQAQSVTQIYSESVCPPPGPSPSPTPIPSATPTAMGTPPTATPTATGTPPTATPTGTPCALSFSDVQPGDYFYTPVLYLACHGVISGYAGGTFRPYADTTRAQMVKIVVLGFGYPIQTPPPGVYTFADVPPTNPFWPVIETAAAHQVVSGYHCGGPGEPCPGGGPDYYFRPYANVTRGQLSKITVAAAGWIAVNPPVGTFADVLPGTTFYPFVETAVARGVISGYACGGAGQPCDPQSRPYFRPANNATRGQIAKIEYGAVGGH